MMEFTASRIVLMLCGTILLASVAAPISDIFEEKGSDEISKIAEADADMIDAFYDSEVDVMCLRGDVMLPSNSYTLVIDGHFLTVTDPDGNAHVSALKHASERIILGFDDIAYVMKSAGGSLSRSDGIWIEEMDDEVADESEHPQADMTEKENEHLSDNENRTVAFAFPWNGLLRW